MTALPDWDIASDAELVCSAAAGDRRAFAGIYDRYADRLHDFCVGMVRDRDAAADCVQDVFCTAATRLSQLSEPDELRPWLYAIARNEALRCLRSRRREQVSEEVPEQASAEPDLETLAARTELAELVSEAAGGLSERDRSVLELAYRHGLDGPELAEALDVSTGTANKIVSRLRDTIEHSLGALLVARRAQHNPDACPELAAILAGWDGHFSILMRKRISRHIESCSRCGQDRRQLVNPVALLGAVPVFIPAPAWLRDHTLGQIRLTSATGTVDGDQVEAPAGNGQSGTATRQLGEDERSHRRRRLALLLILLAALISAAGLDIARLHQRTVPIAPADLTGTATQSTSGQAATTARPNNPPPPPPIVDSPISSILTTSPTWTSTQGPGTTPAAPPPSTARPSRGITTHTVTTPPTSFFAPTPMPSFTPTTHEHAPGTGGGGRTG
jgi:RNA polymerase sigma factor (sigma-70 family)